MAITSSTISISRLQKKLFLWSSICLVMRRTRKMTKQLLFWAGLFTAISLLLTWSLQSVSEPISELALAFSLVNTLVFAIGLWAFIFKKHENSSLGGKHLKSFNLFTMNFQFRNPVFSPMQNSTAKLLAVFGNK